MKTETNREINRLSSGIQGFYTSKKARRKRGIIIVSIILPILIVTGTIFMLKNYKPQPQEQTWQGKLIVICQSPDTFKSLFEIRNPEFLKEYDMTWDTFYKKTNISLVFNSKGYNQMIETYHLEEYLKPNKDFVPASGFYFILLSQDGELLYKGTKSNTVIEYLNSDGFPEGDKQNG